MTRPLAWVALAVAGVVAVVFGARAGWLGDSGSAEGGAEAARALGAPVAVFDVEVLGRYPHDPSAFTQGLLWHGGKLYESTGLRGASRLRRVDHETGEVEREVPLERALFGEGLALIPSGDRPELLWLTWTAGRALRFDLETFERLGEFAYQGQGWGLCWRDGDLYRTDGTATLWRHAASDFAVLGRLQVTRDGAPVASLNELECTPEGLWANVWQSDEIVRIDAASGRVTAVADAGGLMPRAERPPEGVLNGIAYRPETGTYFLTGKRWPWLFEVALEERR